jgi:hypothetical protein
LRNKTNTGGLKRAEGNISKELGGGSGSEVDSRAVLRGSLIAKLGDALLLEEFVSTKLEGSLKEVSSEGWANTSPNSAKSFLSNNLSEATNETAVVLDWVKLYSCLDTF